MDPSTVHNSWNANWVSSNLEIASMKNIFNIHTCDRTRSVSEVWFTTASNDVYSYSKQNQICDWSQAGCKWNEYQQMPIFGICLKKVQIKFLEMRKPKISSIRLCLRWSISNRFHLTNNKTLKVYDTHESCEWFDTFPWSPIN